MRPWRAARAETQAGRARGTRRRRVGARRAPAAGRAFRDPEGADDVNDDRRSKPRTKAGKPARSESRRGAAEPRGSARRGEAAPRGGARGGTTTARPRRDGAPTRARTGTGRPTRERYAPRGRAAGPGGRTAGPREGFRSRSGEGRREEFRPGSDRREGFRSRTDRAEGYRPRGERPAPRGEGRTYRNDRPAPRAERRTDRGDRPASRAEGRTYRNDRPAPRTERRGPPREFNDRPRFERARSERPQGERPRFDRARPERSQSERPHYERSQSERPQSPRPRFERPRPESPGYERPRSNRPQTERPPFERPRPERSQSDRPRFERPRPERPRFERPRPERAAHHDDGGDQTGAVNRSRPAYSQSPNVRWRRDGKRSDTARTGGHTDTRNDRAHDRPRHANGGPATREHGRPPAAYANAPIAPATDGPSLPADPREAALRILHAVDTRSAFSDRLLDGAHARPGADPRDRALLHEQIGR